MECANPLRHAIQRLRLADQTGGEHFVRTVPDQARVWALQGGGAADGDCNWVAVQQLQGGPDRQNRQGDQLRNQKHQQETALSEFQF